MTTPDAPGLLAFFTDMEQQGRVIVRDTPKLDLDLYIQNYTGRTRFERLLFIGRSCVPLCLDALRSAVTEAKNGKDVDRYRRVWECVRTVAPSDPEATFDQSWADQVDRENRIETQRLEAQLKGYKNNLIKESIRMGNEDLGRHYEMIGDLTSAAEAYNRMRTDVSTPRQIISVGQHLVDIAVQRQDWSMVLGSLTKITGVQSEDENALQPYVKILQGIANLGMDKYDDAARSFLNVNANARESKDAVDYSGIASPNDVAVYGGLLALATMDRTGLQNRVLANNSFRTFLELEPHIRKAISLFVNGRYSACLQILESYRSDYLLDVYLQRHVNKLYSNIRNKCIVQYFAPFSCVTLSSLNDEFAPRGQNIEPELVSMIKSGDLKARINTIDKLLVAVDPDQRAAVQALALEASRTYEREALERIRQMSLTAADMEVKGAKKLPMPGHNASHEGSGEGWFDNGGSGEQPLAAAQEA